MGYDLFRQYPLVDFVAVNSLSSRRGKTLVDLPTQMST